MIPPKVQQVLDEIKEFIDAEVEASVDMLENWHTRLQSPIEEMQQERQAIVDAATERAAQKAWKHYLWALANGDRPVDYAADESIRALIGQPLPESGKEGEV